MELITHNCLHSTALGIIWTLLEHCPIYGTMPGPSVSSDLLMVLTFVLLALLVDPVAGFLIILALPHALPESEVPLDVFSLYNHLQGTQQFPVILKFILPLSHSTLHVPDLHGLLCPTGISWNHCQTYKEIHFKEATTDLFSGLTLLAALFSAYWYSTYTFSCSWLQ